MSTHINSFRKSQIAKTVQAWHATIHVFDEFKLGCIDLGLHFGTREQALNRMKHFDLNGIPVQLLEVELDVGNTLFLHEDVFYGQPVPMLIRMMRDETMFEPKNIFDCEEVKELLNKYAPHVYDESIEVESYDQTVNDYQFYREIESFLSNSGFDSINYYNEREDTDSPEDITNYSWCIWDVSRIKVVRRQVLNM